MKTRLMTAVEVAKMLNVSVARVYELARLGLVPRVAIGRQVRFHPDVIQKWVAAGGQALPGGWKWDASGKSGGNAR